MAQEVKNTQQLLDRIAKESAGTSDPVRLQSIVAAVGSRSCGPLLLPFSASSAGLVFSIFGLSLTMHDGLLAITAFVLTIATYTLLTMQLL